MALDWISAFKSFYNCKFTHQLPLGDTALVFSRTCGKSETKELWGVKSSCPLQERSCCTPWMKNFQAQSQTEADSKGFGIKTWAICPYQSLIIGAGFGLVQTLGFLATGAQILVGQRCGSRAPLPLPGKQLRSRWMLHMVVFGVFSFQRIQSIFIPSTRVNDNYFMFLFYINVS